MAIDTAELDAILADTTIGSAVVYGSQTTNGILDVTGLPDELTPEGLKFGSRSVRLGIRNGALTGLVNGNAITVAGSPYHIRDCGHPLADGMRYLTLAEG